MGMCNPKVMTWARIKSIKPHIKLVGIWGDSAWTLSQECIKHLMPYFDLHLTLDIKHPGEHDNVLALWGYPYASNLFYGDPKSERFIDVSFVGSVANRPDRVKTLDELEKRGIKVQRFGGQLEQNLSFEEYATIFRQSRISLNFTTITSKGRSKEALLCGSCLFEPETSNTKNWLIPNKDYVAYKMNGEEPDYDTLAEQINYYLKNEKKRMKIAEHGYNTVQNEHSGMKWWTSVFNKLGFDKQHEGYVANMDEVEAILGDLKLNI
jgi:hypothetical protein